MPQGGASGQREYIRDNQSERAGYMQKRAECAFSRTRARYLFVGYSCVVGLFGYGGFDVVGQPGLNRRISKSKK